MTNDNTGIPQQLTVKEALEQGNRLIAEFMGHTGKTSVVRTGNPPRDRYGKKIRGEEGLKLVPYTPSYDTLWDRLMPVIEKISKIEMGRQFDEDTLELMIWTAYPTTFGMPNPKTGRPMVRLTGNALFEADTMIEAAWLAVVDFIKWYNDQKTPQ
jgi:hypothetical protein